MSENIGESEITQQPEKTLMDFGYNPSEASESKLQSLIESMSCFSDAEHATAGTLKLMDGEFGGGFFIRYLQDCGSKRGWLELTIVYPDNTFKKLLVYKNSLRQTSTESSGVYLKVTKSSNGSTQRTYEMLSPLDASLNWLHQYERPDMPIPGVVLVPLIRENYSKIPICEIHQSSSLDEIYIDLYQRALEYSETYSFGFMDEEDRFFVPSGDFNEIADFHGWSKNEVKEALDTMGLLVKDKNPRSFQFSKRVKGEIQRFYVIRKKAKNDLPKALALDDTTYKKVPQSKQEAEIARLKKFVQELQDELLSIKDTGKTPSLEVAL